MCVRGCLNKLRRTSTCYVFVLQEKSQQRRSYLASLYEYMQSCSKELIYLSGQQDRIIQRDWSDLMVDPPSVRMEYEVRGDSDTPPGKHEYLKYPLLLLSCLQKFKKNGLLAHESEINKLQNEGDRLVEKKHPGSSAIKASLCTMSRTGNRMMSAVSHLAAEVMVKCVR